MADISARCPYQRICVNRLHPAFITFLRGRLRMKSECLARQRARGGGGLIEDEFLLVGSDNDWLAGMQIALENFLGQRVFKKTFHRAAHGTRAVLRVMAFLNEKVLRLFIE